MPVPLSKIQPPTGHEFHHGHGPCRGTVFPQSSPRERVAAWRRGAASYLTPEVDTFRSGGDFPVWTFPFWAPPAPNRTGTSGTRCVQSARFLFVGAPHQFCQPPLNRPAALPSIANASFSGQNYARFLFRVPVVRGWKPSSFRTQFPAPRSSSSLGGFEIYIKSILFRAKLCPTFFPGLCSPKL